MKIKISRLIITVILFCAVFILLVFIASKFEKCLPAAEASGTAQQPSLTGDSGGETDIIYSGGRRYQLNKDITTLLVMGIDNFGEVSESDSYNNTDQADFLMLVIIDNKDKSCTLLHLNRDTMTDVTVLGLNGVSAGTVKEQLALAHTYGSGTEDSCENTISAVSGLLYGIKIDYYLSMTMTGIAVLNDLIGGVTLTVTADFDSNGTLKAGETVTLTGDTALIYVRDRKNVSDGSNLSRMERQRQYINAFILQFLNKYKEDNSLLLKACVKVSEYIVTNLEAGAISQLVSKITGYKYDGIITPAGVAETGAEYMEFYADDAALRATVISLYYQLIE
jgi:cell envelope-related function transcriptional attenuator common domain